MIIRLGIRVVPWRRHTFDTSLWRGKRMDRVVLQFELADVQVSIPAIVCRAPARNQYTDRVMEGEGEDDGLLLFTTHCVVDLANAKHLRRKKGALVDGHKLGEIRKGEYFLRAVATDVVAVLADDARHESAVSIHFLGSAPQRYQHAIALDSPWHVDRLVLAARKGASSSLHHSMAAVAEDGVLEPVRQQRVPRRRGHNFLTLGRLPTFFAQSLGVQIARDDRTGWRTT